MFVYNIVFRNNDRFAITTLLREIGENTLNHHCWNRKLNKPRRLNQFFLEANEHGTRLKYRYPQKGVHTIMEVDKYELPECGWIRVKVK
ncbi:hypothetical protein [Maribacter arenosus]|uniref:Uncharacterized protein n=1 Tax=Maribacter arenosus TaxID=1854708 RepID=A0ABR7VDZ9_9FLAO|nr:hypothetical protein [Maribacter arenosus]MBD0851869.1 hypothetical protein [Maribacter arenosus]